MRSSSIPVDKNMNEILASIREAIQLEINEDVHVDETNLASNYPLESAQSSSTKSTEMKFSEMSAADELQQRKLNTNSDVLELTQAISDDGTVTNIGSEKNRRVFPQPILRRPYSAFDRTPSPDQRHYPDSSALDPNTMPDLTMSGSDINQFCDVNIERTPPADINRDVNINNVDFQQKTKPIEGHTISSMPVNSESQHNIKRVETETFETVIATPQPSSYSPNQATAFTEAHVRSDNIHGDSLTGLETHNTLHSDNEDHKKKDNGSHSAFESIVTELVRESLRPILTQWLDAHLPDLVRSVVAERIEQMFKR